MKGERDLVGIERLMGLKSSRGISRQKNLDAPPIQAVLERIKHFSKTFVSASNGEIRTSQDLKHDARQVFDHYGPEIWPGPDQPRPSWLEEPSVIHFDGKYPRHLYYTHPHDRDALWNHFYHLVVQKVCNYHDNQLQKQRRSGAKLQPEDNDLTPGTPKYDDSPLGPASDSEIIDSERPTWLPINHTAVRHSHATITPMGPSPVTETRNGAPPALPGGYVTHSGPSDMTNGTVSMMPKVQSPASSPPINQMHQDMKQLDVASRSPEIEVDQTGPVDDTEMDSYPSTGRHALSKRKRLIIDDDEDDEDYEDGHEDERMSKRPRGEEDSDDDEDDDEESLIVKLKVNNRALAMVNAKKATPNNQLSGGRTTPLGTRTRSASIAHSTPQAEQEGTRVRVKQYKDNKGKWYEVNIESRPAWAIDERTITRMLPPEKRRRTWVSRHAAFSPNTLSTSETRGSLGAVSASSRPSSIAGPESQNTGRRDSVRSEEQREKEAQALAAASAQESSGKSEDRLASESSAEYLKPKVEPGLEQEANPQLLAADHDQATADPERHRLAAEGHATAWSEPTSADARDSHHPADKSDARAGHALSRDMTDRPKDFPRHGNSPQRASDNATSTGHSRTGSGNDLPDRTVLTSEKSRTEVSKSIEEPSSSKSHPVLAPLIRSPPAQGETREAHGQTHDDQRRSQQPSNPAPGALKGVPWPPNPYAAQPPTGAPPIQVHGSPFSLSGSLHGHSSPPNGQDPRILAETARFRFVDQNPALQGPPSSSSSQQQPPLSQRNRVELQLNHEAVQAIAASSPATLPSQGHHAPVPSLPSQQQHIAPGQTGRLQPIAPSGSPMAQPGPQNGPHNGTAWHDRPATSNVLPIHAQNVQHSSPIIQHRPPGHNNQPSPKEERDPKLVFDVLGDLADCPVGRYIQVQCADLTSDRECLCVVKETLLRHPEAQADWQSLEATLKLQCTKDQYFCATAIDKHKGASLKRTRQRRGEARKHGESSTGQTPHTDQGSTRKASLPPWAVDPSIAPKALPAVAGDPKLRHEDNHGNRQHPNGSMPVSPHQGRKPMQMAPDAGQRPRPPPPAMPMNGIHASNFSPPHPQLPQEYQARPHPDAQSNIHSQRGLPPHRPLHNPPPPAPAHSHPLPSMQPRADVPPSPAVKSEDLNEEMLNNTFIEINWGRGDIEYSDHLTMHDCRDCATAEDFFGVVEAQIPDELRGKVRRIKEIRVKALNELKGKDRLPRFVRNNGSVRAGMRSLVKVLKQQPPGTEAELEFLTVWE